MRPWIRYTLFSLVALVVLAILLAILSPVFFRAREKGRSPMLAAAPPASSEAMAERAGAADETGKQAAASDGAAADRKIITTGDMTIEVANLDEAIGALTVLVRRHGGFLANRSVSADEEWRRADLTIRVPADRFEALHEGARGLGTVRRDNQEGEDVTRQWQDLEARLRVRKAHEESLLALIRKQGTLSDLLKVEKELWNVREEIERAEGELRYLRDKVTLATLTVHLNEEVPAGVGKIGPWNLGHSVLRALRGGLSILRGLLVAVIYLVLAGWVIWLPVVLVIWWIRRRRRAQHS